MKNPNFLIIGAQKAGTTWLWEKVAQHPDVFVPELKELSYFNIGGQHVNQDSFQNAYLQHFIGSDRYAVVGESTPGYFWSMDETNPWCKPPHAYNAQIPQTVKSFLGSDVRLIVSLRNPIQRAISAFFHHFHHTKIIQPEDNIIDVGDRYGIVDMGFYYRHLTHWLETFPLENFLILQFRRDIKAQPRKTMNSLFSFLDLQATSVEQLAKPSFAGLKLGLSDDNQTLHPVNIPPPYPHVWRADTEKLRDIYEEDIRKLGNLLAWDVSFWLESPATIFSP